MPVEWHGETNIKEIRRRCDEIGTDFLTRLWNKKAITVTLVSARCPFMEDNIEWRERCLNIETRRRGEDYWSFRRRFFVGSKRKNEFSYAISRSFRKWLFEQDLLTCLKVSWPFLYLFLSFDYPFSFPLIVFSHPCHECLTFAKCSSFFSTRLFPENYYRGGRFKALPLYTVIAFKFDHVVCGIFQ